MDGEVRNRPRGVPAPIGGRRRAGRGLLLLPLVVSLICALVSVALLIASTTPKFIFIPFFGMVICGFMLRLALNMKDGAGAAAVKLITALSLITCIFSFVAWIPLFTLKGIVKESSPRHKAIVTLKALRDSVTERTKGKPLPKNIQPQKLLHGEWRKTAENTFLHKGQTYRYFVSPDRRHLIIAYLLKEEEKRLLLIAEEGGVREVALPPSQARLPDDYREAANIFRRAQPIKE